MVKKSAIFKCKIGFISIKYIGNRLTLLHILEGEPISHNQIISIDELDSFALRVYREVEEYLSGERRVFDLEIDLSGCSDFSTRVYHEMLKIPYGSLLSYQELATKIGCPKGARAVGMAANRNPWHLVVPCHRVIGKSGKLTGYAAGLEIKARLLELESQDWVSLNNPNTIQ